jgi:hypothetical protein
MVERLASMNMVLRFRIAGRTELTCAADVVVERQRRTALRFERIMDTVLPAVAAYAALALLRRFAFRLLQATANFFCAVARL